jgi:flagellar biosynthesis regulator FlaF
MDEVGKRLWLLEKEIKALEKKIDLLVKAVSSVKKDVEVLLSVQKTWKELVTDVVEDRSGK